MRRVWTAGWRVVGHALGAVRAWWQRTVRLVCVTVPLTPARTWRRALMVCWMLAWSPTWTAAAGGCMEAQWVLSSMLGTCYSYGLLIAVYCLRLRGPDLLLVALTRCVVILLCLCCVPVPQLWCNVSGPSTLRVRL